MSNKYSALLSNDVAIEIVSPNDFKDKELRVLKQFDPVINGYFPYCYDPMNYDLIYVHIKSTSKIMDQAFVWEYLRAELTDAIRVPYLGHIDRVERIQKWSGLFEQIFLIYKWKTCGVTLPREPLAAVR